MKPFQLLSVCLVSIVLVACGGGGGGGGGGATPVASKNLLFAGDEGNHALASFTTLTPAAGTAIAANVLGIKDQQLWLGIAYDGQRDRLYASSGKGISVFDQASALNGNIVPSRQIVPEIFGGFSLLYGVVLDKAHDRLYVGFTSGLSFSLAVFDNVSTLSGNVAPKRIIGGLPGDDFAIDGQRGILYSISFPGTEPAVYAYPNIDQINGPLPRVAPAKLGLPGRRQAGIALDVARDRLYTGVLGVGVAVVDNASTALMNQTSAKPSVVVLGNTATKAGLAFDPNNDRLYVGLSEKVYILNAASQLTASSTVDALSLTAPSGSQITTFAFP